VSHWWEDKDRLLLNSSRRHVFDDKVGWLLLLWKKATYLWQILVAKNHSKHATFAFINSDNFLLYSILWGLNNDYVHFLDVVCFESDEILYINATLKNEIIWWGISSCWFLLIWSIIWQRSELKQLHSIKYQMGK
jgi:hypothetical protein